MRGHLRKRGERSWAVVVDVGHDPRTGKRRQKWFSVKGTKRDAERRLVEIISGLNTGTFVDPGRVTLSDYLDQWMQDYVAASVRPKTAESYATIVRKIQDHLGGIGIADLKPQQIQRYYSDLLATGLSAGTVIHRHRLLRQALAQAVKWDILPRNIMERVTPPRAVKPQFRSLEPFEVRRLLEAAGPTNFHLPIHLALYTGLRRSEILGLRWSDIDLGARTLVVNRTMVVLTGNPAHIDQPKSRKSRRSVVFGEETASLLRPRRAGPDAQVCARLDGVEIRPRALSVAFRTIADSCGLGVRFHDLRHTHASILLASGVPVHVVQARLGHESIKTTVDVYGHVISISESSATFEQAMTFAECLQTEAAESA